MSFTESVLRTIIIAAPTHIVCEFQTASAAILLTALWHFFRLFVRHTSRFTYDSGTLGFIFTFEQRDIGRCRSGQIHQDLLGGIVLKV